MRSHSDIVKAAGPAEIALARGKSIHTVRSWVIRDRIPADEWAAFAERGWATLEELAESLARKVA